MDKYLRWFHPIKDGLGNEKISDSINAPQNDRFDKKKTRFNPVKSNQTWWNSKGAMGF